MHFKVSYLFVINISNCSSVDYIPSYISGGLVTLPYLQTNFRSTQPRALNLTSALSKFVLNVPESITWHNWGELIYLYEG